MSVRRVLTQKSRPYKIEIYGLQDNFIGTLQSYNDSFIGQVREPIIEIKDDGSQSFTCSIPKFYINPETNLKVENPRWGDIKNGILAENTRVLKVFLEQDGVQKVYPFIVDKITDKRDSHFSIYKEIEANGLAFSELGKQGYKLELNSYTLETDYEEDNKTIATINYWLDKVFPNERDKNGNVIKWLTPWCYEIRMDWSNYTASDRLPTKIYEDSYISSWTLENENNPNIETTLAPAGFSEGEEKARYINCSNSNKYNITQTLAETFGVFCVYEYKCDSRGHFIGSYSESIGDGITIAWTGRKVIFYNRAIKADNPIFLDYQNNLASIQRSADSTELYTKLYVTPIESSTMESGYVSIADTEVNPLLDDFILNFDYLYSKGSITDYQYNYLNTYKVDLHKINTDLKNQSPAIESLTIEINELEAKVAATQKEIDSAQETLTHYQTLRDNDVTNEAIVKDKDNLYSVIFTADNDCYSARLRLEGISASTIVGYDSYKHDNVIFSFDKGNLKIVRTKTSLLSTDENFYILLDEYNYPTEIYTSLDNKIIKHDKINQIYFSLTYSPFNAYVSICTQLEEKIALKTTARDALNDSLGKKEGEKSGKYKELADKEDIYNNTLKEKEALNRKLEQILGPALREGYWTPESYEDPGQGVEKFNLHGFSIKTPSDGAELIYDSEPFDGEELGYYYDSVLEEPIKKYYNYIDISSIYSSWAEKNIEDLTIHLSNPSFIYTVYNSPLAAGNYFVLYDALKYYFTLEQQQAVGAKLEIKKINGELKLFINNSLYTTFTTTALANAANLTNQFNGLTNYLGERLLYNNAGFIFAFIGNEYYARPVLLLNDNTINYIRYTNVSYSFGNEATLTPLSIQGSSNGYIMYYPRIVISDKNVNYQSENFTIATYAGQYDENTIGKLERYKDYAALTRGGKPYITLKITNKNNLSSILTNNYYLNYQISRANEMLYLDAKDVARENSQPRYSYDLTVANVPDSAEFVELGQLVYINDHALGVHAATGYVSAIKLALQEPQSDELTVQNYKTKFEDLFSTIAASSEAMKNNAVAYNIAAAGFTPSGQIEGSVLQNSIANNTIAFNFSNTNVQIDDTQGIILTNTSPYMNGVYGQVALRGGGIFLSNAIDANGQRIWSTGITPSGINASLITTGQLDTSVVRVFAGSNLAFQWNAEGIFAYVRDEEGLPNLNKYVRYSDKGLQYIDDKHTAVDLGWNGLLISTQGGSTELTGDLGLTVYYGQKNEQGTNHAVRLGKFDESEYGLRLYKKDGDKYTPTLITSNNGELWLQDSIRVGNADNGVGITGAGVASMDDDGNIYSPVRFWAGSASRETAPFWIREDGSMRATKATIEGNITAQEGSIGGWIINGNSLISPDELTTIAATGDERININNKFIVDSEGGLKAEDAYIKGEIVATSGQIGGMTIDNLEKDLTEILGAQGGLRAQLISSKGTIANANNAFITRFEIKLYKGNIEVDDTEYAKYHYYWETSEDGEDWDTLEDENSKQESDDGTIITQAFFTEEPWFDYESTLDQAMFFRCIVKQIEQEVGE